METERLTRSQIERRIRQEVTTLGAQKVPDYVIEKACQLCGKPPYMRCHLPDCAGLEGTQICDASQHEWKMVNVMAQVHECSRCGARTTDGEIAKHGRKGNVMVIFDPSRKPTGKPDPHVDQRIQMMAAQGRAS